MSDSLSKAAKSNLNPVASIKDAWRIIRIAMLFCQIGDTLFQILTGKNLTKESIFVLDYSGQFTGKIRYPLKLLIDSATKNRLDDANAISREVIRLINISWEELVPRLEADGLEIRSFNTTTLKRLSEVETEKLIKSTAADQSRLTGIASFLKIADCVEVALDGLLIDFGLPRLGPLLRAFIKHAEQIQKEGRRLRPDLTIGDERSMTRFLGTLCSLTNVQPSEITSTRTIEGFAGFVDVAIEERAGQPQTQSSQAVSETPSFKPPIKLKSHRLVIGTEQENPSIDGYRRPVLLPREYRVIRAIVDAKRQGQDRITGPELDTQSKTADARKVLQSLANKDAKWKAILIFPKKKGDGYGIR